MHVKFVQLNPAVSNSVISNLPLSRTGRDFSWICPRFFSVIYYLELGYLEHLAISNCLSLTLAQINYLSRTLLRYEETLVNISQGVQLMHL